MSSFTPLRKRRKICTETLDVNSSEPSDSTLPLSPADAVPLVATETISNINQGTGTQHNSTQVGGYQNTQYNAEVQNFHNHEPSRTPVEQPWRLPREAAGNYAGYAEVLGRLETCFLEPHPEEEQMVFVLSGMGGVGKSESVTIAVHAKTKQQAPQEVFWATFWIDCNSEATVRADFKSVATLCGWATDDSDLLYGTKDSLASLEESTLLILDNCDDPKVNYSRYIPNSSRVNVILTTRLSNAGKYASLDPHKSNNRLFLRLHGLDEESAAILILNASETQERDEKTRQYANHIASALEYHPFALVVASSLIQSITYSLEEYAEALTSRFAQTELLNTESEQATYRKVSTTFEVSADTLRGLSSTEPSAKYALALLDVLGFMHHQGVSEDVFLRAWEYAEEVSCESSSDDWRNDNLTSWHVAQSQRFTVPGSAEEKKRMFRSCRAHLLKLSLVSLDSTGCSISLHSLVHSWARERLQHPFEVWTAAASILALSTSERRAWQSFTPQLAKHLETCYSFRVHLGLTQHTSLGFSGTWYAFAWQMYRARSPGTLALCQKTAEELRYEGSDGDMLEGIQYLLGSLYQDDGQIPRAIETLEHVVKVQEEKLAEDHPDRLASLHEVARAYQADGQISRAIEILEHVVKVQKKLVEDHPSRLVSQHCLASAYQADRQISRAMKILQHVVKIRAKLAENHPDRLVSQHELACAYIADGQFSRAIETLEHVVKVKEKKLAEDDPRRLVSQYALAIAYWDNGQRIEAEQLMRRVVMIRRKSLRVNHPYWVKSEKRLAYMAEQNSRWKASSSGISAGGEQASDDRLVQTPSKDAVCGAGIQEE